MKEKKFKEKEFNEGFTFPDGEYIEPVYWAYIKEYFRKNMEYEISKKNDGLK